MTTLTNDQLGILRHMLGIDKPGATPSEAYRDYYCANPGDPEMAELERIGMVRCYRACGGGYEWFTTTGTGRTAAFASLRAIRLPKRKRVYRRWLDISDCYPDLTFGEFLTSPEWADERRSA